MPNLSRYAAAAKGSRNVAAQGSISLGSLRAPKNASVRAMVNSTPRATQKKFVGSAAGLRTERKAYVQMNGADYDSLSKHRSMSLGSGSPVDRFTPGSSRTGITSNMTRPDFHGLRADRDMSKLL